MNSKLYLVIWDYDNKIKIEPLEIERETPGQFRLKGNKIYTQILNKTRFIDEQFFISPTSFRRHIIIWGEENIPQGIDRLLKLVKKDIESLEDKMYIADKQYKELVELRSAYNEE